MVGFSKVPLPRSLDQRFLIVFNNAYFLLGVFFLGWCPVMVFFGFWVEAALNYLFTTVKVVALMRRGRAKPGDLILFLFHYAACLVFSTIFFIVIAFLVHPEYRFMEHLLELLFVPEEAAALEGFRDDLIQAFAFIGLTGLLELVSFLLRLDRSTGTFKDLYDESYDAITVIALMWALAVLPIVTLGLPVVMVVCLVLARVWLQWWRSSRRRLKKS
jgi:hypothetical protein